jgi:hypothetical protein
VRVTLRLQVATLTLNVRSRRVMHNVDLPWGGGGLPHTLPRSNVSAALVVATL